MTKEFEPCILLERKSDFNVWEYHQDNDTTSSQGPIEPEPQINELEQLRQEASEQGYAEGLAKAQAEIEAQKAQLAQWIDLLQQPIQLIDEALTQEMIQAIIWLCHRCIGVELSIQPEKLQAIIQEIKGELPSLKGKKELWMNAADIEWLKSKFNEPEYKEFQSILNVDDALSHGDFYLKGDHSELDGRLHSRLITLFGNYLDKDNLITPPKMQD